MNPPPALHSSALGSIGSTPLIALDRLYPGPGRLLAKAEFLQPGGSIKDRAALYLVRTARASGALREGQAVVEMTSGNMGAGLAIVCGILGHPFVAVMSARQQSGEGYDDAPTRGGGGPRSPG